MSDISIVCCATLGKTINSAILQASRLINLRWISLVATEEGALAGRFQCAAVQSLTGVRDEFLSRNCYGGSDYEPFQDESVSFGTTFQSVYSRAHEMHGQDSPKSRLSLRPIRATGPGPGL